MVHPITRVIPCAQTCRAAPSGSCSRYRACTIVSPFSPSICEARPGRRHHSGDSYPAGGGEEKPRQETVRPAGGEQGQKTIVTPEATGTEGGIGSLGRASRRPAVGTGARGVEATKPPTGTLWGGGGRRETALPPPPASGRHRGRNPEGSQLTEGRKQRLWGQPHGHTKLRRGRTRDGSGGHSPGPAHSACHPHYSQGDRPITHVTLLLPKVLPCTLSSSEGPGPSAWHTSPPHLAPPGPRPELQPPRDLQAVPGPPVPLCRPSALPFWNVLSILQSSGPASSLCLAFILCYRGSW